MDYSNLREKTIFDFTKDEKILKEVFPEGIFEVYMENPDEFIKNCKNWLQPRAIVLDIIEFSNVTNNKILYNALKKEFNEQYPNDFREVGDPFYFF